MLNYFIRSILHGKITLDLKKFVSKLSFKQTTGSKDYIYSEYTCTPLPNYNGY